MSNSMSGKHERLGGDARVSFKEELPFLVDAMNEIDGVQAMAREWAGDEGAFVKNGDTQWWRIRLFLDTRLPHAWKTLSELSRVGPTVFAAAELRFTFLVKGNAIFTMDSSESPLACAATLAVARQKRQEETDKTLPEGWA